MRRASICLVALGLLVLSVPAAASAAPEAKITKFVAKAIPIPKKGGGSWPKTGNFLGAGAAVEASYEIEGSGYGVTAANPKGGIPPVSEVDFFFPKGVKLNPGPFAKCTAETLKRIGPSGCPPSSFASPTGSLLGEVTFGTERVPESSELTGFFGGPGLLFFVAGHTPVSLEIVSEGHYVKAAAPYGEELVTLAPAVATVPGAPLASVKSILIKGGAAVKKGTKTFYYGTLPTKCSKFLPVKTVVTFGGKYGGEREFGIEPLTAEAVYHAPCPKKKH